MKKTNTENIFQIKETKEELILDLDKAQNLTNYIYLTKVFTPEECQKIIDLQKTEKRAQIATNKMTDITQRNTMASIIYPEKENGWLYKKLILLAKEVNKKNYKFDITEMEFPQVLKYKKKGFYNWHMDLGKNSISRRKIGFVIFLSDRNDYEGGKLNFFPKQKKISQEQGSLILFPTYMFHKVDPVKKGTRYSMVTWFRGSKKFN